MRFDLPNMLWLLALVPLVIFYLLWAWHQRRAIAQRFGTPKALQRYGLLGGGVGYWLQAGLFVIGFICLILALARPQWGFHERRVISKGIDMMVAVDTSDSMLARDFQPDRITRAKDLLKNLIWEAKGSRVGVVAFAGRAVVMCPLTLDYNMASTTLKALDVNTVTAGGTNIAAAIDASLSAFEISGGNDRVLIILTDGEQLEDTEKLKQVAAKAADEGVRIFAIGIGSNEGAQIPTLRGPKLDPDGNVVVTKMNMDQLEEIADTTNGKAFKAERMGAGEIADISAELAQFKGEKKEDKSVRVYHERYPWFVGAGAACFVIEALIRHFRGKRRRMFKRGKAVATLLVMACIFWSSSIVWAYPGESFMKAREAYQKFNSGEYDPAKALYEDAARLKPNDPQLLYNLGATAARAKNNEEAKAAFRSVYDPSNPILNADALFGAATIEHHEMRDKIKDSRSQWNTALLESPSPEQAAMEEVKGSLEKLKDISKQYQEAIIAKPGDDNMKANYELLRNDIAELEQLLKAAQDKQEQQQQQEQEQKNDQQKQDSNQNDNKDGQGQSNQGNQGQQPGEQKDNQQDKQGNQEEKKNEKDGPQNQNDESEKPGEESQDKKDEQGKPQDNGDKDDPNGKPADNTPPKATPTPSPTPGQSPAPGTGQQGEGGTAGGKADPKGTPVPIGQMSPSDVDRLLNTLPSEDEKAMQLMFMQPDSTQDDMKHDW